ncbi:MAG: DUF3050 domain-containing protein [Planctomycetaceae bacterium]
MAKSPSSVITEEISELREQLLNHPVYSSVCDIPSVRVFMEQHVFAVWDFMSLLKRLQRDLCCCDVPWLPRQHGNLTRFINEIVLGEESDVSQDGTSHLSHFDLYRQAMDDVASDGSSIDQFLDRLRDGDDVSAALSNSNVADSVSNFVQFNCDLAANAKTHEVASAFCFGREDIIPDMFERLLASITDHDLPFPALQYYVERHIELDGDHHGPLSLQLMDIVVGDSQERLDEAIQSAKQAIQTRISLWDGVCAAMRSAEQPV